MTNTKHTHILAIETSCDETAASVISVDLKSKDPSVQTLSNVVRSQISLHSKMGGVVPEVAARAHSKAIRPVVEKALRDAFPKLATRLSAEATAKEDNSPVRRSHCEGGQLATHIDYIAVTTGPGLVASLLVGTEFAKALSFASGVPLISVNHMEGHLYSPFGESQFKIKNLKLKIRPPSFPILSLVVSGGHTLLIFQKNESHYQVLGSTVDDAAGEAFDKVAKLLGLPYPGGPEISKIAQTANAAVDFPRPMINRSDFSFSFSGLKTAVLYYLEKTYSNSKKKKAKHNLHHFNFSHIPAQDKANIALGFEQSVVDVLVTKALRAATKYKCQTISLSGGVAANRALREKLKVESEKNNIHFIVPDFRLCTDNAEMIAIAAYFKLRAGKKASALQNIKANPAWEL